MSAAGVLSDAVWPMPWLPARPCSLPDARRHETRFSLGTEPVPVPEPFVGMLLHHLHNRPHLRTAGGMIATPWLFPGYRPGKHLDAQSIVMRLRWLGINLLGARNSALGNLVAEVRPPPYGRTVRLQLPSHPTPRRTCRPTMVPIHHLVIETTAGFHDHELAQVNMQGC